MVMHSVHLSAPFYRRELHAEYPASIPVVTIGAAILDALHKARFLFPAERDFADAVETLRGKRSYTAFHKGMGWVSVDHHNGRLYISGWESDGRGHVPIKKLSRTLPTSIDARSLGRLVFKFLRASQQFNIPAIGWDRRTARPL